MKNQTINLKYSMARAKALSHYLEKSGKTIESELLSHIDELYDTQVPEVVREFVASQNPEDQREDEPNNTLGAEKSARQSNRKRHSQTENNTEIQTESGPILTM